MSELLEKVMKEKRLHEQGGIVMAKNIFTGENLIKFIENNPQFKKLPINYLFVELLKRRLIQPSEIINAYSELMQHKLTVAQSHYEDACVTALQIKSGNFSEEENKKKMMNRFFYNTSFSKSFPQLSGADMTEEEKKKWSDFWEITYGFRPEEE